jgi:hypothetical protein
MLMMSRFSQSLVACNVYVSGGLHHVLLYCVNSSSGSPRTLHGSLEIITIQANDDFNDNDFNVNCAVAGRV